MRDKASTKDRIANAMMIVGVLVFFAGLLMSGWLVGGGLAIAIAGGVVYVSDKG